MPLRVDGGEARGRGLRAPRGIRPSAGVTKAAIFNILGTLEELSIVDLYAGSGALGIEALSRGAAEATFVERDPACVSILRQNLAALGYLDRCQVVTAEVTRWLERRLPELARATLILADPPYGPDPLARLLAALERTSPAGATIAVEHSIRDPLPVAGRLHIQTQRRYGDSAVAILRVA